MSQNSRVFPSIGRSVGPSVGWSVGFAFAQRVETSRRSTYFVYIYLFYSFNSKEFSVSRVRVKNAEFFFSFWLFLFAKIPSPPPASVGHVLLVTKSWQDRHSRKQGHTRNCVSGQKQLFVTATLDLGKYAKTRN